jgi:hypothetical protein
MCNCILLWAICLVLCNCRLCNGPILCTGSLQTRLTKSEGTNFMGIKKIELGNYYIARTHTRTFIYLYVTFVTAEQIVRFTTFN